jgi:undecaprenyl pyrophosphate phosphatase UppP
MAIVKRYSLASFVIYRIILGVLLLYLVYTGFFAAAA